LKEKIIKTLTKENLIQGQKQAKLETLICMQEDLAAQNDDLRSEIQELNQEKADLRKNFEQTANYLLDVEVKC
jgi:hypothetical protein